MCFRPLILSAPATPGRRSPLRKTATVQIIAGAPPAPAIFFPCIPLRPTAFRLRSDCALIALRPCSDRAPTALHLRHQLRYQLRHHPRSNRVLTVLRLRSNRVLTALQPRSVCATIRAPTVPPTALRLRSNRAPSALQPRSDRVLTVLIPCSN